MLRAARAGLGTPRLARFMLGLAVAATLASNVAYGARFGITGSLLSGWPAVAFIGSAELAIGMARRARAGTTPAPHGPALAPGSAAVSDPDPVPAPGYTLNGHGYEAERIFADDLAAGDVPSIRAIRAAMRVGQPRAREIQAHLEGLTPAGRRIRRIRDEIRQGAGANGHAPQDTGEPAITGGRK